MNVLLAILFVLMLLTPCLIAFRSRARHGAEEEAKVRPAAPAFEREEYDFPRAGVLKTKKKRTAGAVRVVTAEHVPVAANWIGEPIVMAATVVAVAPKIVEVQPVAVRLMPTLQERVNWAEEEARIAGVEAMRARDRARGAHARAVALREELASQTAEFARYVASEAAEAAHAAQVAYDEMRAWSGHGATQDEPQTTQVTDIARTRRAA